jgi:cell fate (sporulation/competence/biofilm development) regulator YlbF (YheA/YmcA/DUF963 family)
MSGQNRRKKEISDFYREEFVRHRSRLETQRMFYPEQTYSEIESALDKIIEEIDRISQVDNFEEMASHLLHRIDVVTSLSSSKVDPTYRVH